MMKWAARMTVETIKSPSVKLCRDVDIPRYWPSDREKEILARGIEIWLESFDYADLLRTRFLADRARLNAKLYGDRFS